MSVNPPAGMPQSATSPIPDVVRGLDAIAVALLSRDGALWDANRGFFSLLRGTELSGTVTDVRHVFAAPSFDALLARPADPVEGLIYRGVLTLREAGGKATPLRGAVFAYDCDLLLVAEHEITEVRTLRARLLAAEAEITARDDEIERLRSEIQELRGLTEAALRDRDALLDAISGDQAPSRT
ncbi:MAG: hypothetical protein U1E66_00825 [Rhodospirillales bacterium]